MSRLCLRRGGSKKIVFVGLCWLWVAMQSMAQAAALQPVAPGPAASAVPGSPAAAKMNGVKTAINLFVGQVKVIERSNSNVVRVAVGRGSVLKATVTQGRQIILLGQAAGETNVHLWMKDGSETAFSVVVTPEHTARLKAEIQTALQDTPEITTRVVGSKILLEGQYRDAASSDRAKVILAKYPDVVNLIADDFKDVVKSTIRVDPMIYLDLRVIEVRKRALDQLGIKWANTADGPTFASSVLGYADSPWPGQNKPGYPLVNTARPAVSYLGLASQITSALQFLEQNGDSYTLAEPRLSCKSGGKSKFVAGGEIPIPVATGIGQTSVVYKQYGVVIEFSPVADAQGNIESQIEVEVSEPDSRNSNQGFVAFTTNRTTTQVALKHNTPLVISGLLRQQGTKSMDGIPGLSKLPILGAMFRTKEARSEESELLVVVTPRLVTAESALNTDSLAKAQAHVDSFRGQFKQRLAD